MLTPGCIVIIFIIMYQPGFIQLFHVAVDGPMLAGFKRVVNADSIIEKKFLSAGKCC
jgi:hypothetical protein